MSQFGLKLSYFIYKPNHFIGCPAHFLLVTFILKFLALMETLSMDNLLYSRKPASMKIEADSLSLHLGDQSINLPKESIKNFELFRGLKGFCLRISFCKNEGSGIQFYDIYNITETSLIRLRSAISSNYGSILPVEELETFRTTEGNLTFSNDVLSLHSDKQIFSIPKTAIKKVMELDNDIQLDLGDVQITFNTTANISHFLSDKSSEEICIINGVNCINPRSKSTIVFFDDYFVLKGSSYDHTIMYDTINEMFFLKYDSAYYMVFKLENCIVQGQTRYDSLVFLLTDKDVEIVAKDSRLKTFYSGKQYDVVLEIFESLTSMRALESLVYCRCTSKVFDGNLYFLSSSLLFLPKSFSIPLEEISSVEFSRINLSLAQAKTFDMTIIASKIYNFNGIQKDSFAQIEQYFGQNAIKMVSEVIEDSYTDSSSGSDDESGDLSDIIGLDE